MSPAVANKPSSAALALQAAPIDLETPRGHVLGSAASSGAAAAAAAATYADPEDSTKRPVAASGKSGAQFLRLSM